LISDKMESGSIFYQLKANELIENGSDKFEVEENLKNNINDLFE